MPEKKSDFYNCDSDMLGIHDWKTIGVDGRYVYSRCMQCKKCKRERIYYVEDGMELT